MVSAMRTTWTQVLYTPLPDEVSPQAALNVLHDHPALITLSPIVDRYERSDDKARSLYSIHENVPLLFGLTMGVSFTTEFDNTHDGVVTHVNAPIGLVSTAVYQIMRTIECLRDEESHSEGRVLDWQGNDVRTQWCLRETIESEVNILFKHFVDYDMVMSRRKLSAKMMEDLEAQAQAHAPHNASPSVRTDMHFGQMVAA